MFDPDSEVYAEIAGSLAEEAEGGNGSDRSEDLNEQMDLHSRFVWEWKKRKVKLEHKYAMAGFALSVFPDVWEHASLPGMLGPKVRITLEQVVRKLHKQLNLNMKTLDMSEAEIMDQFWWEFNEFRARRGVFESDGGGARPAYLRVSRICGMKNIPCIGPRC